MKDRRHLDIVCPRSDGSPRWKACRTCSSESQRIWFHWCWHSPVNGSP